VKISHNLSLTPLTLDHAPEVLHLVDANRIYLEQYLYWVKGVVDIASCGEYIHQRVNSGLPNRQWYAICFEQKVVGVFAIKSISDSGIAELGYWLSESAAGNGIISQIVASTASRLQHDKSATALEFCCLEKNTASMAVATRAGALFSHDIDPGVFIDGQMQTLKAFRKLL